MVWLPTVFQNVIKLVLNLALQCPKLLLGRHDIALIKGAQDAGPIRKQESSAYVKEDKPEIFEHLTILSDDALATPMLVWDDGYSRGPTDVLPGDPRMEKR
jgi:hypothetical protein